ncbi:hypothetical protein Tco_1161711, partial [Tanacetum coccineum]
MERAATTASSLEAEQDSGNTNRTQSMATLNESFPQGTGSGSGPRVNTLRSREDNMKLNKLIDLCTKLPEKDKSGNSKVSTARALLSNAGHYLVLLDYQGSEGFHQRVDFLNTSHIRYALTENPTIYVSLIQQFWQTATANILDNGEIEITAIIDGKVKTVSDASIRSHLKLEDADGISNLPTIKNFKQLALMGQETEVPRPSSPPYTNVANEVASTGVDVRYRGAVTTITGLEAEQGSGNIDKTPTMPHSCSFGDRLDADKESLWCCFYKAYQEGEEVGEMDKLSKSRRKLRLVFSDEEGSNLEILAQDDPSKQGRNIAQIDEDKGITLEQIGVSTASIDFTTANVLVTTAGAKISIASPGVKTAGDSVD